MVKPKNPKSVQSENQRKITSFFISAPVSIKRSPQHNSGVSPDAKRANSSSSTTNIASCRKDLSQNLGSRPASKLSLGRPRAVLREKSQLCSGESTDSDSAIPSQTQTKKSTTSSPAAVSKTKSGKGVCGKQERKGSENVPGRSSVSNFFKPRHGGESSSGSGKTVNREREETDVLILFDSPDVVKDTSEDTKLNRTGDDEEEEEFPDSTPDFRDKYDFNKLIKGKTEGESSSDSEDSSDKHENINRDDEKDKSNILFSSQEFDTSEAKTLTHKEEENKKVLMKGEEKEAGNVLMLSDVEDLCSKDKCAKLNKERVQEEEEERSFALSDLSEDLFESPRKQEHKSKVKSSFWRGEIKRTETDAVKSDTSDEESTSSFFSCSQGFQHNGGEETDRSSRDTHGSPRIFRLKRNKIKPQKDYTRILMESSLESKLDESIDLFPELKKDFQENQHNFECDGSSNNTSEATTGTLEGSQEMRCTQKVKKGIQNNHQDSKCDEESSNSLEATAGVLKCSQIKVTSGSTTDTLSSLEDHQASIGSTPSNPNTQVNGDGSFGSINRDNLLASPRIKTKRSTPLRNHRGDSTPGTPKINDPVMNKLNGDSPGTSKGKVNDDNTPEVKINDESPCIPKGTVNGNEGPDAKVNGDFCGTSKDDSNPETKITSSPEAKTIGRKGTVNGNEGPDAEVNGDFCGASKDDSNPDSKITSSSEAKTIGRKDTASGNKTPEAKISKHEIGDGGPESTIIHGGSPDTKINGDSMTRTPRKEVKVVGERKLSRQEEMDCLDILEMFGDMSPFKEKPPSSKHVHRPLRENLAVKKFLGSERQDEESFSAKGNFGRHLVLSVERDGAARRTELELLSPENVRRTCTLAGVWSNTVIRDGDIIHLLLTDPVDGHYHIDDNQGLLVVHPDLLLSSTTVVSGVFCRRRAVLSQWHRGTDSSMAMLIGSLVHELFQEAVVDAVKGGLQQVNEERLRKMTDRLVCRRKVLQDLYCLGRTLEALKEEMVGYIPRIQSWCRHYLGREKQKTTAGSYKWPGNVVSVEDVEENIWSPRFGLKGKVDMVVSVEGPSGPAVLPLELKTGRASFSSEHRGQLSMYAMMASDRRPDPGVGLLLYLREEAMEEVKAPVRERRDLLCLRNELAHYLSVRPEATGNEEPLPLSLPPPIPHERACRQCPHLVTCSTHLVLRGEVPPDPHPMASLVPQHTAHLSPQHLEYFRHWCLLLQMESGEELGGGGAMWCRKAAYREEKGECLAWLVVASPPPSEVQPGVFLHTLVRGSHHPGSATPLVGVGLHPGDRVVVSSTTALALATGAIQGFKGEAVLAELDRPLQAGPGHHYHLDHFQNSNFIRLPMLSLGRLLLPEPRATALRRLLVDRAAPTFRRQLPRTVMSSAPLMKHLNTEQRRAVLRAATAEDFLLVEGFPGTGKSSTVAALVQVLLLLGRSVLITAHTNAALDSLLLKLHARQVDFMRLGRGSRIHPDLASHTEEIRTGKVATVEQLAKAYEGQRVVASTCLGLTHPIFTQRTFDVCIVDEAAQVLQVTALAPLFLCSSFVLVGDAHQLPPLVRSQEAVSWGMTETLFERLQCPEATVTLTVQYRMNGPIMALANTLTYQGQLKCGSRDLEVAKPTLPCYQTLVEAGEVAPWLQHVVAPTLEASVLMVDTLGQAKEEHIAGKAVYNPREAWLVVTMVKTLLKAGLKADEVGIIAPYRAQVKLLKTMLSKDMKEEGIKEQGDRVEVNTVDQYQGRDKTVIICTFVRCGRTDAKQAAGILTDRRRLNVALTRAKRKVILIGDVATLTLYQPFSCLLNALTPQQLYKLTPGTDGFTWKEEEQEEEV